MPARTITLKGAQLTLVGRKIRTGMAAPGFIVTGQDMKDVRLSDFDGKTKVITTFYSLDTSVCDLQVKEFNARAASLPGDVRILGVSKDLPFAQKRFCESVGIKNISVVSDYKTSSLGINYGLLIKEMNLLARAVVIVDAKNILRYIQIVEELSGAPDYASALAQLEIILKNPSPDRHELLPSHCAPCEAGALPMSREKIGKLLAGYRGWDVLEDKKLVKEFMFRDFVESKYFVDLVSVIAEEQGHHPTITIIYNKVRIILTTHAAAGLTENDFIMAKFIDELGFEPNAH